MGRDKQEIMGKMEQIIPLYPRFDKYDLKGAGTDTLPFLSILFL